MKEQFITKTMPSYAPNTKLHGIINKGFKFIAFKCTTIESGIAVENYQTIAQIVTECSMFKCGWTSIYTNKQWGIVN